MLSGKTISNLKKKRPKRILVQVPEGLKTKVLDIAKEVEELGATVIISADPCYGACDLKDSEAERLGCDLLLHIGHSNFGLKTKIPTIYEEYKIDINPIPILKKNFRRISGYKRISLLTTVQHIDSLGKVKLFLERNGKKVFLGKARGLSPGQVLGCRTEAASSIDSHVDCHIFIGSGLFHPIGILEKTRKPVFVIDVEKECMEEFTGERNKNEIKRRMRIEKARGCNSFGILVSTKPGQMNIELAEKIKHKLESKGKRALILSMDEITSEKILGINIDCLVNTSCPRLVDDRERIGKMIISAEDVDSI